MSIAPSSYAHQVVTLGWERVDVGVHPEQWLADLRTRHGQEVAELVRRPPGVAGRSPARVRVPRPSRHVALAELVQVCELEPVPHPATRRSLASRPWRDLGSRSTPPRCRMSFASSWLPCPSRRSSVSSSSAACRSARPHAVSNRRETLIAASSYAQRSAGCRRRARTAARRCVQQARSGGGPARGLATRCHGPTASATSDAWTRSARSARTAHGGPRAGAIVPSAERYQLSATGRDGRTPSMQAVQHLRGVPAHHHLLVASEHYRAELEHAARTASASVSSRP